MWPSKLSGEGAKMYTACYAMCDIMPALSIAVDIGKGIIGFVSYILQFVQFMTIFRNILSDI